MGQQSVRQAARRSALDAQAERRKECVDCERRLEGLAVEVLTALGERVSGPDQVFIGRCGGLEVTIYGTLWERSVAPILGGPPPTSTSSRI
jgi:hypothetical protein